MRVLSISSAFGRFPIAVLPALVLAAGCAPEVTRVGLSDVERRQLQGVMPV